MKKLFTLLLSAACFTASAQSDIDYPYNPDFENDGFVGIEDVLELLSVYGAPFTPEQLLLDGASLTEIIESLQTQIDSLASFTNEGFGALVLNDSLLTEYLVGVAAASEEGDSTLAAWVMQLSEVVEQQQAQIDSLTNINASSVTLGSAIPFPIPPYDNDTANNWTPYSESSFTGGYWAYHASEAGFVSCFLSHSSSLIVRRVNQDGSLFTVLDQFDIEGAHFTIPLEAGFDYLFYRENGDWAYRDFVWTPIEQSPLFAQDGIHDSPCRGEISVNYHGYDYDLVEIGDQCWFREDLKTNKYKNGESIYANLLSGESAPAGYLPPCNSICGNVYNKFAVIDDRGLCPAGFHIPTSLEWSELIGATLGHSLAKNGLFPSGFDILYGNGGPSSCEGNNCGSYFPDSGVWGNLSPRYHTSTISEESSQVLVDIEFGPNGLSDWTFENGQPFYGFHVRCIKD